MKVARTRNFMAAALIGALVATIAQAQAADPSTSLSSTELRAGGAGPLPSRNGGKAKHP